MATILVVDDNASNRAFLAELARAGDHRVLESRDALEALKLIVRDRPDVVVTDILMPAMDGYEFVRQLRRMPMAAELPVIFWTGLYQDQQARSLALQCGVSEVLSKPVEPEHVLAALSRALGKEPIPPAPPKQSDFDRDHLRLVNAKLLEQTEELRAANSRLNALASIVESSTDAIIGMDTSFVITSWNHGAVRLFGYSPAEAIGQPQSLLVEPGSEVLSRRILERAALGERIPAFESRRRKKSGELVDVAVDFFPVRNASGEISGFAKICRDITAVKRAQTAILESESRFRALSETLPHLVLAADAEGACTFTNRRWKEFRGRADEQLSGTGWLSDVHPEDREGTLAAWRQATSSGTPTSLDVRLANAVGQFRWFRFSTAAIPCGTSRGTEWFATFTDVHDQHLSREAVQAARNRLEWVMTALHAGVWDWDLRSNQVAFSTRWKEMMGYSKDEAGPDCDHWRGRIHPEDLAGATAALESHIAGRTPVYTHEHRLLAKNGQWRWLHDRGIVVRDENGLPIRIVGSDTDITDRVEAEIQARASERRLRNILDKLVEGVAVAEMSGKLVYMNPAALCMHRMAEFPADLSLHDFESFLELRVPGGDPIPPEQWPMARALRQERFYNARFIIRRTDSGAEWIASYNGDCILDQAGKPSLAILSFWDITREHRAAEELKAANTSLYQLSGQLLRMQDEERRRLARELHDSTVQTLSAISMNLSLIAQSPAIEHDEKAARLVVRSIPMAKEVATELRTLAYLLHPPALDTQGLPAALRSMADGFGERTGIETDVALEEVGRFSPDAETALFRIAQEALANVHRHSGSTVASLRLSRSGDSICLEVEDEGKGLVSTTNSGGGQRMGVGILGMRERARQLGGELELKTKNKGVIVRACVPGAKAASEMELSV